MTININKKYLEQLELKIKFLEFALTGTYEDVFFRISNKLNEHKGFITFKDFDEIVSPKKTYRKAIETFFEMKKGKYLYKSKKTLFDIIKEF